jgi:hypothetical protein
MTVPASPDWTLDPVERARFLDGEGTASERAAREACLSTDPVARARVEREAAFLAVVRRGAAALPPVPPGLEARVRAALAADRAAGLAEPRVPLRVLPRARAAGLVAAACAAGLALWLVASPARPTHAADEAVLAAETARGARDGRLPGPPGAACEQGVASPYRFPLVAKGELEIAGCGPTKDASGVVSVVNTQEDPKHSRALVSVPARADAPAPSGRGRDVGVLVLDDMVVFDVALGGARYYLAAPRESVDRLGSCAACHGSSRDGQRNPHRFLERAP